MKLEKTDIEVLKLMVKDIKKEYLIVILISFGIENVINVQKI